MYFCGYQAISDTDKSLSHLLSPIAIEEDLGYKSKKLHEDKFLRCLLTLHSQQDIKKDNN